MFYGENLTNLRELNGLSRKELAIKLSITEQAVWQYENESNVIPKLTTLVRLSELFNVTTKYFFRSDHIKAKVAETAVAYRAKDRNSRKKTRFELTYLNYVNFFLDYFEQYLVTPPIQIIKLQQTVLNYWQTSTVSTNTKLTQIAETVRNFLKLKNNYDLMYKLERSGIYILEKDLGMTIDAYSTWTTDQRPFIILGNIKKSAVRRNFDLAHELGHLLLHTQIDMETLTKSEYKQVEQEANDFAADFLLPETTFKSDFLELHHHSNPDSYIDLKQKYLVSIVAMEYRAYKLHLITYQENRYFYSLIYKRGYKSLEPLDDQFAPHKPGKIKSLFEVLLQNNVLDWTDFLMTFHLKTEFISKLFNLQPNLFDHFLTPNQGYFTNTKIVPLRRPR